MEGGISKSPALHITDLPQEVVQLILRFLPFGTIGKLRKVSKYFNSTCSDLLNIEFLRLKAKVQDRFSYLKSQLPRRESSRKNHPLANENDVMESLHLRVILLNISIGLHVKNNNCCFFAGEILDECNRLLTYIDKNGAKDVDDMTNEIFDLTTMAVEYFKSKIEPTLPSLWYGPEPLENPFDFSMKEESSNFQNLFDSPLQEDIKKSLNNLKIVTIGNHKSLQNMKADVKDIEMECESIERLVHVMKQQQKECKVFVLPEKEVNNVLHKINQCELMLDSIASPPKSKKMKKNYSKNADNSTCTTSKIEGNILSLNDNQCLPSCSTSKVLFDMFDEEMQQMNVLKHSEAIFSMQEEVKLPLKRKRTKKVATKRESKRESCKKKRKINKKSSK